MYYNHVVASEVNISGLRNEFHCRNVSFLSLHFPPFTSIQISVEIIVTALAGKRKRDLRSSLSVGL